MTLASWHTGLAPDLFAARMDICADRSDPFAGQQPLRRMERPLSGYKVETTMAHIATTGRTPNSPTAHGSENCMPNEHQRPQNPLVGAGAAVLVVVALLVRRKKRSRSDAGSESIADAAVQVKDAGGHALGKAASAARDLMSDAADLVGDRHLNETLDRLQSALDDARSAAAAAVRKAPIHRH